MVESSVLVLFVLLEIFSMTGGVNLVPQISCTHFLDYTVSSLSPNCYWNPDIGEHLANIVRREGYPLEVHNAVTGDGFIIELYRLPRRNAQPILLQSGILMGGNVWVDKKNRSLAFQSYDRGYDTWIGAYRSSTYAKGNLRYSPNDNEYWEWSMDAIGLVDVPTMVEYVAKVTGKGGEIIYVGHSMGTTVGLMYASEMPEHASRFLKGMSLMSPIAVINAAPPLNLLVPFSGLIRDTFRLIGIRGILRHEDIARALIALGCRILPLGCYTMLQVVSGKDDRQFPADDLLLFIAAFFTSASLDQSVQYLQIAKAQRLQKFDYGIERNKLLYGQELPPQYNLSNIALPLALVYGPNDNVARYDNVENIYRQVSSKILIKLRVAPDGRPALNHLNIVYGKGLIQYVYEPMFEILAKYFTSNWGYF